MDRLQQSALYQQVSLDDVKLTPRTVNPFSRRESHGANSITTYKVLTLLSWLLSVVVTVYYAIEPPHDGRYHGGTIWHQNYLHYTAFTLNSAMTSIYWFVPSGAP